MSFWDFFWLMVWGFIFVSYLMVLFQVIIDIFRDDELSGWARAGWVVALFIVPPVTALVYILVRGSKMQQRSARRGVGSSRGATADFDRTVYGATDPTDQIVRAKSLLDTGGITEAEYQQLKAKALG